jgi:hypothetical protein
VKLESLKIHIEERRNSDLERWCSLAKFGNQNQEREKIRNFARGVD